MIFGFGLVCGKVSNTLRVDNLIITREAISKSTYFFRYFYFWTKSSFENSRTISHQRTSLMITAMITRRAKKWGDVNVDPKKSFSLH